MALNLGERLFSEIISSSEDCRLGYSRLYLLAIERTSEGKLTSEMIEVKL